MKRIIAAAALSLGLLSLLMLAVQQSSMIPKQDFRSGPLRFGATVPLTGISAPYGVAIQKGIDLAVKELKASGIPVTVAYEDVPVPGPVAVTAIRNLIDTHRIEALVGNFYNPAIPAMAPALMRGRVLAFHTAEADDKILDAGDYIFSTNAKIADESREMANLAVNTFRAQKAAVLYVGTTFGENYNTHFTKQLEALGGVVIYSEMTALGDFDLRTPITKALAQHPDVIIAAHFGPMLGTVLRQVFDLGATQPIISVYEAEDQSVLETSGVVPDGRVFFFTPSDAVARPASARFKADFEREYEHTPNVFSANAYDATLLAAHALTVCDRESPCARREIAGTKLYEGASGTLSIDEDGAATKSFTLKTISGNSFIPFSSDSAGSD